MPAVIRSLRAVGMTVAVGSLCLVAAPPVAADQGPPGGSFGGTGPGPSGKVDGDTLSATATGITFDLSRNGRGATAGPVAAASDWAPPACWYAPKYTPEQLQKTLEPIWAAGSTGSEWDADQRRRFVDGEPYKDFNKEKSGEGYFWDSFVDKSFPPGWDKCDRPVFWVDRGDPPPADAVNAVTPEILAALAYAEIRVPATSVTLAPAGTTKVNLPTWAWLDGADFEPVSVTASVPVLGISATTTATPVALRIEPGTPDAETYPASGVCPLTGGRIGEPYARGKAGRTPPCGVRYLRSSGDGSFTLRATLTWRIDWTGSGGTGGDLPDGTFGTPQTVVVQEIQSVNR
ncbi:hypothetical protein ACIPPJ_23450 [Streptomyces sp. NPDC086091]|uniref:hypothetical protein n=1 Tax=Streptomyces sp. NPDC086091 TaxID=3365751 RepID=UPI0038264816